MDVPGALVGVKGRIQRVLRTVRDRSPVTFNLPPESGIGVGNMFTYWLWAHQARLRGEQAHVLATEAMAPWLSHFPRLQELTAPAGRMKLWQQRVHDFDQRFPADDRAALESFIRTYLLAAERFRGEPDPVDGLLTVNVRRGDYYSSPKFRPLYSFNIPEYVQAAVTGANEQLPVTSVAVVSDDPQWCRENLGFLSDYGPVGYQSPQDGPIDNLVQLSRAGRLVLGNSSFSYWAAYISNTWHDGGHELTWAPWFHCRRFLDGAAFQLDPRWSVVEEIPSRWAAV